MADGIKSRIDRMRTELNRSTDFLYAKWPRRILTTIVVIVVLFGLFGFFGVPLILRHVLTTQVATSINRPVTIGKIAFNPYRLRLDLDQLHIADRDPQKPFVDLGHLRVKVSWTSLFRLAPVVQELTIVRPALHLVRTGDQQFNFSDLLVTRTPPQPASKLQRFAVSNIRIQDGDVRFDDQVLNQSHAIEHLELGVPFIADLPADTDIFVQPLLHMVVDGSTFLIGGRALPFLAEPESSIGVSINHFNLALYMGYVPAKLPIKLPAGALSAFLQVHFVQTPAGPIIRITGNTSLDGLDVRDSANAPLAGFKHANAVLDDVEPLGNIFHLGAITLDTLNVVLVRNRDGTTNLTSSDGAPGFSAVVVAGNRRCRSGTGSEPCDSGTRARHRDRFTRPARRHGRPGTRISGDEQTAFLDCGVRAACREPLDHSVGVTRCTSVTCARRRGSFNGAAGRLCRSFELYRSGPIRSFESTRRQQRRLPTPLLVQGEVGAFRAG